MNKKTYYSYRLASVFASNTFSAALLHQRCSYAALKAAIPFIIPFLGF